MPSINHCKFSSMAATKLDACVVQLLVISHIDKILPVAFASEVRLGSKYGTSKILLERWALYT